MKKSKKAQSKKPRISTSYKGWKAEHEVCNILAHHFGGRFERRGKGVSGEDINCPEDFPYVVEIKHHAIIKLKHLWRPIKKFQDFWEQASKQALKYHKMPLLIVKIEGLWLCFTKGISWENSQELNHWCALNAPSEANLRCTQIMDDLILCK